MREVRPVHVRILRRARRQQHVHVVHAGERLEVAAPRADVSDLDRVIRQHVGLQGHVVVVVPRRLVVELDAAQGQAVGVDVHRVENDPIAGVEPGERSVGQSVRRGVVRRLVDERELERIVVAEARVAAAVLERAVEEAVPRAHDVLFADLVRGVEPRREVVLRHLAEAAAELVRVDQLDAVLREVVDEARRERHVAATPPESGTAPAGPGTMLDCSACRSCSRLNQSQRRPSFTVSSGSTRQLS